MIYEVCEMIGTHLATHPTLGLAAMAAQVPKAVGDPSLETVSVKTEFEIPYLPLGTIPAAAYQNGPLVFVRRADDAGEFAPLSNPEVIERDGRVGIVVLVLYPRQSQNPLHIENRRCLMLVRAVARSLGAWLQELTPDDRDLREVRVIGPLEAVRISPNVSLLGGQDAVDVAMSAVMLDLKVTDRWAEGITPLAP